ncbi:hypothetical protein SAMN06269185_2447 [Natronoarchaeum philippinense]|uniref:Uncharacterized protein n=1 Tax=Natronoarchaeum philippinense TaxID=558529 RepID=A0A285P5X4_NATPI|nr:hypothetical protein [Natronoarchaeum philippinense]SNZ15281.1 hypothetical protein SAMN06269185_2447 [Natronoarchaeum philippinense]
MAGDGGDGGGDGDGGEVGLGAFSANAGSQRVVQGMDEEAGDSNEAVLDSLGYTNDGAGMYREGDSSGSTLKTALIFGVFLALLYLLMYFII